MTVTDRLREIEERAEKATEGPWVCEWDSDQMLDSPEIAEWPWRIKGVCDFQNEEASEADAEFIAHARSDVPFLLALLRESRPDLFETSAEARS